MTATTPPPSGPISLADVRQALADTDPSGTNAGALRKIMGRGSYPTIQKHLDAIRQNARRLCQCTRHNARAAR
ncbi:MAG: DNA-binding protein [Comamonadaceae bacterium]|nr:DNA-binding protein [Comamonadaceae bacterium]